MSGHSTPEEAALSGYSPSAQAHVVSVTWINEWHAVVVVDMVPSHPMESDCHRGRDGLWTEFSASSA